MLRGKIGRGVLGTDFLLLAAKRLFFVFASVWNAFSHCGKTEFRDTTYFLFSSNG